VDMWERKSWFTWSNKMGSIDAQTQERREIINFDLGYMN
jgi:hypothetical protein